jgi:hypothetical protein
MFLKSIGVFEEEKEEVIEEYNIEETEANFVY